MSSNNLASPFTQAEWVRREEVIKSIKRAIYKKQHFYLSAPGGYGKTVSATQFIGEVGGETAWFTVRNKEDNWFYKELMQALAKVVPNKRFRDAVNKNTQELTLSTTFDLLDLIPPNGKRCYIVIDDLHAASDELKQSLPYLLKRIPAEYITVGLLSREDLSFKSENIAIIDKYLLAFSTEETKLFCETLKKRGLSYTPEELTKVTEGWIIGIQALALSGIMPTEILNASKNILSSYFRSSVWNTWDKDTKMILLSTAYFYELNVEAVSFVIDDDNLENCLTKISHNNAFIRLVADGTYQYHDLFRDFLVEQAELELSEQKLYEIRDRTADWFYRKHRFLNAAKLYIENSNNEKINACFEQTSKLENNVSIDSFVSFSREVISLLPEDMIHSNYNLLIERAWFAFLTGDSDTFTGDMMTLFENQEDIVSTAPEVMEKLIFLGSLLYTIPLSDYALDAAQQLKEIPDEALYLEHEVNSSQITHNLPYFHRSMRDFSDYYELNDADLDILKKSFGKMIGRDYITMDLCLRAGILYEQNSLTKAAELAFSAYGDLRENTHFEVVFCTNMLLCTILDTFGATKQIDRIYQSIEKYINDNSAFEIQSNFTAMQTRKKLRENKDVDAAKWWLIAHPIEITPYLSFYRLGWHFATLESYLLLEKYEEAIIFGKRLINFGEDYRRPLDEIEARIILSVVYLRNGQKKLAIDTIKKAVDVAIPYGYIRQFINYGEESFIMLRELEKTIDTSTKIKSFLEKIYAAISLEYDIQPASEIKIPPRRLKILKYLSEGLSYKEIADTIGLTHGTVKNHVLLLYKDLGVGSAEEAVQKGNILGII